MGSPIPARIPEAPIEDLSFSSDLGYGRSKLVAEHVIQAAMCTAHANATILRIGQVVGDQKHGIWNENEMVPMIVHSGLRMGTMPVFNMQCEWLPVDTLAEIILELAGVAHLAGISAGPCAQGQDVQKAHKEICNQGPPESHLKTTELIYNIRSPHTLSWTNDFLPALTAAGLHFSQVSFSEWLNQLESVPSTAPSTRTSQHQHGKAGQEVRLADGVDHNPALKLLKYLKSGFHTDSRAVFFEIDKAKRDSTALRGATHVVESGLVGLMVRWWVGRWMVGHGV